MHIFYFTATGNSLATAKSIGGALISIPQVVDSGDLHYKDDIIGIVFPIYGLGIPKMVHRFLSKAKFEAGYTFAIGTYGNLSGAAMLNFQKQAGKLGHSFDYVNDLLMLDNYLPMFETGNEMEKLPKKNVGEKTAQIVEDIRKRRHMEAKASLGARALTAVLNPIMPPSKKAAQKYIINEQCNKCGICAQVCPAKNITAAGKVDFRDQCEGCSACLHLCPKNALHLKNEKSNKRWRHPDVSLKELIEANDRG